MREPPEAPKSGSWEEYRLHHIESLKWLTDEVKKNHDDILVIKTKMAVYSLMFGAASSIITTLLTKFLHN